MMSQPKQKKESDQKRGEENEPNFPELFVPRHILTATHNYFLPYWRIGVETACYWYGIESGDFQVVTTLGIPRLDQDRGYYNVVRGSSARLASVMESQGLVSLAQIHTHPPESSVRHSPYDSQRAYSTREGALSFVWPGYGGILVHDLAETGLGIHERRGATWVRLSGPQITKRIRLVDDVIDDRWDLPTPKMFDESEWEGQE